MTTGPFVASRRVGPLPAVAGDEMLREGSLRVLRANEGYFIEFEDHAAAMVRPGDVWNADVFLVDERAETIHLMEHVVFLLARILEMRVRGRFHVHAGLVVDSRGRGTLIGGQSGAGKTTTTLALLEAGALLGGDDVAFVWRDPSNKNVVRAQALPRPLHVGEVTLRMFPSMEASVRPDALTLRGKKVVDAAPGALGEVEVTRLVFPSIGKDPTAARQLRVEEILPRLFEASALVTWPHLPNAEAHLQALGALLRCPAWALQLGPDAIDEPERISAVLDAAWLEHRWSTDQTQPAGLEGSAG